MNGHERIANNIKAEIQRKGLSLKEVSSLTGLSYPTYINTLNRFKKGEDMRVSFLEKTAKALNVEIDIFFKK